MPPFTGVRSSGSGGDVASVDGRTGTVVLTDRYVPVTATPTSVGFATTLAGPTLVGATKIILNAPVPDGCTVTIGAESKVVSSCLGAGVRDGIAPFQATLASSLASTHATGDAVTITDLREDSSSATIGPEPFWEMGANPPYQIGSPLRHHFDGWGEFERGVHVTTGGAMLYTGDATSPAYAALGRVDEETVVGTAAGNAHFFNDAVAGDSVFKAIMSRLLFGTGNGLNAKSAQMILDWARALQLRVPVEFLSDITPATLGITAPSLPTGASGWGVVIDGGAYRLVALYTPSSAPSVPAASQTLAAPGGATVANGGNPVDVVANGTNLLRANQASFDGYSSTPPTSDWNPNNATLALETSRAWQGTKSLKVTATATSAVAAYTSITPGGGATPAVAGQKYTASAFVLAGGTVRSVACNIVWLNAAGGTISTSAGGAANDSATDWTVFSCVATAPALTAYATIQITVAATAVGEVHYIDGVALFAGSIYYWSAP